MPRDALPLDPYALVVCRRSDGRFLVVHEVKHGQGWYLPAGRVDPGETFQQAALRETREEAGVEVKLTGVYRIEHRPRARGERVRMRVFFAAVPVDDAAVPKRTPDEHSLEAAWLSLAELAQLPLRGDELPELFPAVERGLVPAPLTVLDEAALPW